jgi:hypothetical protein
MSIRKERSAWKGLNSGLRPPIKIQRGIRPGKRLKKQTWNGPLKVSTAFQIARCNFNAQGKADMEPKKNNTYENWHQNNGNR